MIISCLLFTCIILATLPVIENSDGSCKKNETTSDTGQYPVSAEYSEIEMSSGHTVEVIVYYPGYERLMDRIERDREAPFPVVIFSPGAGGGGVGEYDDLVSDIASFGFVVAGVSWRYESDREDDVAHMDHTRVIDHVEEMSNTLNSPLYNLADTDNCGAYGHSRGGRSAFLASKVDDRIKSICAWMPTLDNGTHVDQTTDKLLFAGEKDEIAKPIVWTDSLYESCDPPIIYINVTGGDHSPNRETHGNITNMFSRYHLSGESTLESKLYGEDIKSRADGGEFRLKIKSQSGEYDSKPGGSDDWSDSDDQSPEGDDTVDGPSGGNTWIIWLLIIFTLVLGSFLYLLWKKKKIRIN